MIFWETKEKVYSDLIKWVLIVSSAIIIGCLLAM